MRRIGPRGIVRFLLVMIISVSSVILHQSHPEWGYGPLMTWLTLMAIIYGVTFWLWAQKETQ